MAQNRQTWGWRRYGYAYVNQTAIGDMKQAIGLQRDIESKDALTVPWVQWRILWMDSYQSIEGPRAEVARVQEAARVAEEALGPPFNQSTPGNGYLTVTTTTL